VDELEELIRQIEKQEIVTEEAWTVWKTAREKVNTDHAKLDELNARFRETVVGDEGGETITRVFGRFEHMLSIQASPQRGLHQIVNSSHRCVDLYPSPTLHSAQ